MTRRWTIAAAIAASTLWFAGSAGAHVHGITPLLQCSVVPENAGANQTDETPASATNGGPISGRRFRFPDKVDVGGVRHICLIA